MSKALVLVVPEEEMTKEFLSSYYRKLTDAVNEYSSEEKSLEEHSVYERKLKEIDKGKTPIILEGVVDGPLEEIGRDRFDEIFELRNGDFQRTVLEEEGIKELRDMFEGAIPDLKKTDPETNWEATLARHIAMCEFALDHGYKIELSY